jgi:LysM repeat protein
MRYNRTQMQNPPAPQRKKDSWRLRGVTRAAPHLDEGKTLPMLAWIVLGGVVLILIIVAALFLFQTGSAGPAATVIPSGTAIATSTIPSPSSTASAPSPTSLPTSTRSPTATPTASATATATAKPTAAQIKYRVRFGDTLSSIAAKYHVTIQSIMLANRLRTDIIFEGQELIIPIPTPHP